MEAWQNFFLGELGASAALAGLIFVSLSVNQTRILAFSNLPERGLSALTSLFLVLIVSSLLLVPGQTPRLAGSEIVVPAAAQIAWVTFTQCRELPHLQTVPKARFWIVVAIGQLACWPFAIGAGSLILTGEWAGLAWFVPATLLSFIFSGINAWVLLIEINR